MQGGVGDCTNEIARELAARGVDVGVLTSTKAEGVGMKDEEKIIPPSRGAFILHAERLIKTWDWFSLRRIAQTIRAFDADIVHLQFQTGAFQMHPAVYFLPSIFSHLPTRPLTASGRAREREKFIITFHDLKPPYLFPKAGILRDKITRYLARACDAVIATNDEDYARLGTWDVKQLSLIPIGSNIATTLPANYDRAAWRAQYGIGENETLLCYFGFLNQAKGGETLIRALALVPNATLLMIGGQIGASDPTNAAYLARVQALIAELGLSERVLWTGFTPPEIVTANFLASDLCLLPYREGASFRHGTLMAALAHGMPIVTTSPQTPLSKGGLGGLSDGINALLVPPDEPRALADAIQRALASPELGAHLRAGARDLAQHFTWDKIAQQHLELYQRMISE